MPKRWPSILFSFTILVGLVACSSRIATPTTSPNAGEATAALVSPTVAASPAPEPSQAPAAPGTIVYVRANPAEGRDELWSIALDGADDHLLLAPPCSGQAACSITGLAASPDGTTIAYVVGEQALSGSLRLVSADGSGDRLVVDDVGAIGLQAFSPDGSRLAFVRYREANPAPVPQSSLWAVEIGGEPRQVTDWGFFYDPPAWFDDQTLIFSQASIGTPPSSWNMFRIALEEGAEPIPLSPGQLVQLSPDRRAALVLVEPVASNSEQRDLGLLPLDGAEPRLLTRRGGPAPLAAWSPDGTWIAVYDPQTFRIDLIRAEDEARQNVLVLPPESWIAAIAWSTDGRSLIYRQGATLRLLNIDSGQERSLTTNAFNQLPQTLAVVVVTP